MQNGIVHLSDYGLLKISGIGAKKLLQGQITQHIDEISTNKPQLSALCDPQGRVISLFYLLLWQDAYYLQMPRALVPMTLTALKKYAVFFKVSLEDVSDAFWQYGCMGEIPNNDAQLTIDLPGEPRRQIQIRDHALHETFLDEESWKYYQIINGLPSIYPETSQVFLPHELNLHLLNAISFNKGCYTGQEIIARMHYRGKLKTSLKSASTQSPFHPRMGADIYNDTGIAGSIVDFCKIGYNTFALLIIVNDSQSLYLDAEKHITIRLS